MNVFAAASLTEAFPKFDGGQRYNFAGSDALAAQIRLGAPADLFAAASPDAPQALYKAGLVEQPVTFATNKLVLAVPTANPAGITSIYDIERPGVKLADRDADGADRRLHAPGARLSRHHERRDAERRQRGEGRQGDRLEGRPRHRGRRLHVRHGRARGLEPGQADPGARVGAAAGPLPDRRS